MCVTVPVVAKVIDAPLPPQVKLEACSEEFLENNVDGYALLVSKYTHV